MKVVLTYPPIKRFGKYPLISQNRQFRYSSSNNVRIYPIVLAQAATMMNLSGDNVLWLDGINERLSWDGYMDRLKSFGPEVIVMETKAPIMNDIWKITDEFKSVFKGSKIVYVGDHVTAFPVQSFKNSSVDYVICGGDYDIVLNGLIGSMKTKKDMPHGIYFRDDAKIINTGCDNLDHDLDDLPIIDRGLTKWNIYGEAYLYRPCAYIITGRGCGGNGQNAGRCTFCIWQNVLWKNTRRLRSPKNVADEIRMLVNKYKVREVFDDNESGAIWNKEWLREFHERMKQSGVMGRVYISSNARADSLDNDTCSLLKKTGFRLLKIGLESANNNTLMRIKKDESIESIKNGIKCAKDHGLSVLMTTMVGYPWESETDVLNTYNVARELLLYRTCFGDSLQSSVVTSYPGTPLYNEAVKNGWFESDHRDISRYDMSGSLYRTGIDPMWWCDRIWNLHKHPNYIVKTLMRVRRFEDIKLLIRGVSSLFGHTKDF